MSAVDSRLSPQISVSYISASANRHSRTADCSPYSSLVAFGSGSSIALWDPCTDNGVGVFQTLPGHEGTVTCVRFQPNVQLSECFFSGDDRGTLRCWRLQGNKRRNVCSTQAHTKSISALALHGHYIISGSSDASIAVWELKNFSDENEQPTESLVLSHKLDMKGRYPLDIQVSCLPGSSSLIMAVSATDRNVSLWVQAEGGFVKATSLPGHEDWVKCLAFQKGVAGPDILTLASGSQDTTIRLWNIEKHVKQANTGSGSVIDDDLLDDFEDSLGEIAEGEEGGKQISLKRHMITVKSDSGVAQYSVTFDALLVGHEAGITCLAWRPALSENSASTAPILLSTSTDSSLILWSPSSIKTSSKGEDTLIWINQQRFGDVGGQKLGGFVGGLWTANGSDALAWGWGGGWRRWACTSPDRTIENQIWEERGAISGHSGAVRGLSWSNGGEYLISTGPDQTTRIHANIAGPSSKTESWQEICRPQVHGYDLVDAVFLQPTKFVSIADEKVARVFEAPRRFLSLCKNFGVLNADVAEDDRPSAASVPPLGLSNKALSQNEASGLVNDTAPLSRRPFEGELALSTLWPETEKIFGHGYELHALAASHSGCYVATACKTTSPEHAGVRVYNTQTWQLYGSVLQGHALTVTRVAFSPNDQHILSVSRDRSWILFKDTGAGFTPVAADKSHARIIWDCAWSHENDIFATASRDKTVKIWRILDNPDIEKKQVPLLTIKTKESATAVAFSAIGQDERRLLAIGMENGEILIYSNAKNKPEKWTKISHLENSIVHTAQVHRLEWRPHSQRAGPECSRLQLASCSDDGTLRIITLY